MPEMTGTMGFLVLAIGTELNGYDEIFHINARDDGDDDQVSDFLGECIGKVLTFSKLLCISSSILRKNFKLPPI